MALPSLWYMRGRPGDALDNAGLPRCTHPDNNSASRHRCHSTTHGILVCVPSLEWRTNSKPKLQRLQDSFCKLETWDSPTSTTDSIRLSLSGSALHSSLAVLMHTSSPASCSNYGIFISKVRLREPSSGNRKIINIVELCPTVDSPLERTSAGNPRVQYVDQVQNPTIRTHLHIWQQSHSLNSRWSALFYYFLINS